MRFACIIQNCLYSLVESDGESTFEMLFGQFTDTEWLMRRFEEAEENGELDFFGMNAQQAILKAFMEAQDLREEILEHFETQRNPDALFTAFYDNEREVIPYLYQLRKAKPHDDFEDPFIRIYAVRLDDAYVIVSGDVKTTKATKDRKQTDIAANMAKKYREALLSLGIRNATKMNQYIQRQPR